MFETKKGIQLKGLRVSSAKTKSVAVSHLDTKLEKIAKKTLADYKKVFKKLEKY
jgi:N-dimethylarginine dimethylaminohydrolase